MPLAGHKLKGLNLLLFLYASVLPGVAGVYPLSNELAGFLAALTGLDKGDFGIGAKGDSVGLTAEGVAQSPPLAALRGDFEIKPASVIEDVCLVLGLRIANGSIR